MENKILLNESSSCFDPTNPTMTGFNTIGSGGGGNYIGGSNCCNAGSQGEPKLTWDPVPGAIGYEIRARFSVHSYINFPQIYSTTNTEYSLCCHGGCPCSFPLDVGMHHWGVRPVCNDPVTGAVVKGVWQGTGGIALGGGQTSPYESESSFSAGGGSTNPPTTPLEYPHDLEVDNTIQLPYIPYIPTHPQDPDIEGRLYTNKDKKLREEKNRIKDLIKKIL